MRKPSAILGVLRRAFRRWLEQPAETRALSSIDPREFSDLLRGRRKNDLQTLARKLSEHAAASNARRADGAPGQSVSSRGPGLEK
jgi:uncharacterized protein YjiS (DUF1127 family)